VKILHSESKTMHSTVVHKFLYLLDFFSHSPYSHEQQPAIQEASQRKCYSNWTIKQLRL